MSWPGLGGGDGDSDCYDAALGAGDDDEAAAAQPAAAKVACSSRGRRRSELCEGHLPPLAQSPWNKILFITHTRVLIE